MPSYTAWTAKPAAPRSTRRLLAATVALLVLGMVATSALEQAAFDRALRAAGFVEHAQSTLAAAGRLHRSMSDLVSTVETHASLADAASRRRFEAARANVLERLTNLEGRLDNDPEQRQLLGRIRALTEAALAELSGLPIIASDAQATAGVASEQPTRPLAQRGIYQKLDAVHRELDAFEAYEQRTLAERRLKLQDGRTRTQWMLAACHALSLATMLAILAFAMRTHARHGLAEVDARYRVLFDLSPMPMWVLDRASGRFLEVNEAAVSTYGWSRDAFLRLAPWDTQLAVEPEAMRAVRQASTDGPPRTIQTRHRRSDGAQLDVVMSVSDVLFRGWPALLVAIEDRTLHLAAERERERLRRRIDDIVQKMSEGFMLFDCAWRIAYFNDKAVELLGTPQGGMLGRELWSVFPQLADSPFGREASRVAATGGFARVDGPFMSRERWFESQVYATADGYAVLFQEITQRRRNEQLLREREQLLTDLSRKLLRAQEDERRAIARELHDDLLQEVAAAKFSLAAARRSQHREVVDVRIEDALSTLDSLIAQLRNRALDLHPAILEDLGLVAAIDWLCERLRTRTHTHTRLVHDASGPVPRLDRETEAAAFRIVQEAVSNALRHAAARSVHVSVSAEAGRLQLSVTDDGIGMSTADRDARLRDSLGLVSMRERAELLGGQLTIDSAPRRGTRIEAKLPMAESM